MPASMLLMIFAVLVFAPCLVALVVSESPETFPEAMYIEKWRAPRTRGLKPIPLQATLPELPVSEDFEIRSFPKGLSQRRIVVRDTESGVKLTITQVREAAAELVKLAGMEAAYRFALVAAAAATAMHTVKNAVAIAAREVLEGAANAHAWFDWAEAMTQEHVETSLWTQAPPKIAPQPVRRADSGSWRRATQAA